MVDRLPGDALHPPLDGHPVGRQRRALRADRHVDRRVDPHPCPGHGPLVGAPGRRPKAFGRVLTVFFFTSEYFRRHVILSTIIA